MKPKIKTGDKVQIVAGASKGQEGVVKKILKTKDRLLIEGLNMVSKHSKPSAQSPQGGIEKQEASIHISNVSLLDPSSSKPTRVGYKIQDGKKVRYSKKSGDLIA